MPKDRGGTGWLPALLVALVTAYAALTRPPGSRLTDLSVYLGAVSGMGDGASLYDFSLGAAPFTYPPFAGLLFAPLTWLPVPVVQAGWTLTTVLAVLALAWLATRPADVLHAVRPARSSHADLPLVALVLMLSAPVSSNLRYGQVSLLLAVLVLADMRRDGPAQGVLTGLAAAIKLTPLIFIPMLWLGGRRRAAVTAAVIFAACGAAAWVALPGDSLRFWLTEVRDVERLGYLTSEGNQSLNAALLRWGVEPGLRSVTALLLGGLVVLLALGRAARLARGGDWLAATVVTGAAGVVFSPVSWTHHQVWLVLAAVLPIHPAWRWTAVAVMVLPVWGESRLLLAIAVAVIIPLGRHAATDRDLPVGRVTRHEAERGRGAGAVAGRGHPVGGHPAGG